MEDAVQKDLWAVVELMGHGQTAGIIKTSDLGGLLRVDVPVDDGFRTEYYGAAAIYSIKIVSEEIARAFATPNRSISSFDVPIVPRAEYEAALQKVRTELRSLESQNNILRNRLVAVNALPQAEPNYEDDPDEE